METSPKNGWKTLRRALISVAGLATVIGLFYAVENWRGKQAWEACKRELEAKGEVIDWSAYIPAPVPDEQNFFKAPKMTEWFGKGLTNEFQKRLGVISTPKIDPVIAAVVTFSSSKDTIRAEAGATVLQVNDPAAPERAAGLILTNIGPSAKGPSYETLIVTPPQKIKPIQLVIQSERAMSAEDLARFFPRKLVAHDGYSANTNRSRFLVERAGENSFRLVLYYPLVAAECLAASDHNEADFDIIREALKRPYARIDGDYQSPLHTTCPNFISLRSTAQMLANRTQCYLLLDQPEKALRELTLLHDLCRLLDSKPVYLVSAMINVAINGLYVNAVADGLRLQAWREPQIIAIQQQLKSINLQSIVREGFETSRAAGCRAYENVTPKEIKKFRDSTDTQKLVSFVTFAPRGWIYQNMAYRASDNQDVIDSMGPDGDAVQPSKINSIDREKKKVAAHFSPYTFIAELGMFSYDKTFQACARTQTQINQALIVCALERYRLAYGEYPEALDKLAPKFIEAVRPDLVGGKPLRYHRTEDGRFLLYSVGWDETDDGGDVERDWVWGS